MSGSLQLEVVPSDDATHGLLEARELVKTYRQRGVWQRRAVTAVDHVFVSLQSRRTIAVAGESGCGKSTLARLLLNLEHPDAGTVSFDGKVVSTMSDAATRAFRRAVQMVFQHPHQSFNPMLTIGGSVKDALTQRPSRVWFWSTRAWIAAQSLICTTGRNSTIRPYVSPGHCRCSKRYRPSSMASKPRDSLL